jgi:uncharacterized membrane protein
VPVLAAGELVGDKLPMAPPRSEGPGLVGRVVSGAVSGRVSGGGRGARVGAAFALAATYPSQALRAQIVKRTPVPDIACAVPEDLIGAAAAAAASAEPRPDPSGQAERGRPGLVGAAGRGLAAGVVGAGAMTSAQTWLDGILDRERSTQATATRVLYGTVGGKVFGLALGRGERAPGSVQGLVFGAGIWAASLAVPAALGRADAPWEQSPAALAEDLAVHLAYGFATAAAYEAFTA